MSQSTIMQMFHIIVDSIPAALQEVHDRSQIPPRALWESADKLEEAQEEGEKQIRIWSQRNSSTSYDTTLLRVFCDAKPRGSSCLLAK